MEWRPIETAPKNPAGEFHGPVVLIYCRADGMPWPCWWGQGTSLNGTWIIFDKIGGREEIADDDAVAWMPLPPAPEVEG